MVAHYRFIGSRKRDVEAPSPTRKLQKMRKSISQKVQRFPYDSSFSESANMNRKGAVASTESKRSITPP